MMGEVARRAGGGHDEISRQLWNVDVLRYPDEVLTEIDAALIDPKMSGRLD
jgi:hypothetical protein